MIKGMVGQLETRLTTDGGPVEDWAKLITSLGVIGEKNRAKAAYDKALTVFQADDAALGTIEAAASTAVFDYLESSCNRTRCHSSLA